MFCAWEWRAIIIAYNFRHYWFKFEGSGSFFVVFKIHCLNIHMIFQCLFMNDIFLQRSSMARCWHQMWISRSLSICTRKHGISSQCTSAQSLLIRSISQSRLSLSCMQVHLCFYSHRQYGHPVLNTMPWSSLCTVSQLLSHSTSDSFFFINIVHFPCNYFIFTKNYYQLDALYYLFLG